MRAGLALGLLAAATACSKSSPPVPGLYEHCADHCATGTCEFAGWLKPDGFSCEVSCTTDADCPPTKDGMPVICVQPWCQPAACTDPIFSEKTPVACVDGVLHHCEDLASPPCSQCPVCPSTQYCKDEACVPRLDYGQPCAEFQECPGDACQSFTASDGTLLFDGKNFCAFPAGAACWAGDPCYCYDGSCSTSSGCESASDCPDGTTCVFGTKSVPGGSCHTACGGGAAACDPPAACTNIAASSTGTPVNVCAASGPRPPRSAGTPCMTNAECRAGTCCPPAQGETWGHCAGSSGC